MGERPHPAVECDLGHAEPQVDAEPWRAGSRQRVQCPWQQLLLLERGRVRQRPVKDGVVQQQRLLWQQIGRRVDKMPAGLQVVGRQRARRQQAPRERPVGHGQRDHRFLLVASV